MKPKSHRLNEKPIIEREAHRLDEKAASVVDAACLRVNCGSG